MVPFVGIGVMVSVAEGTRLLVGSADPKIRIGHVLSATAPTYAGLLLHKRYRRHETA
jgi:hypothetical protein